MPLHLENIVHSAYGFLGKLNYLEPMQFDFTVMNDLWKLELDGKAYVLKRMRDPDAYFGGTRNLERLEAIASICESLYNAGLPVEHIQRNSAGQFCTKDESGIFRLYDFIVGDVYRDESQLLKCINSLNLLHTEAPIVVSEDKLKVIMPFKTAFPLKEVLPNGQVILNFIRNNPNKNKDFGLLANLLPGLLRSAKEMQVYEYRSHLKETIVHSDFHPMNVLIKDYEPLATMVDMDYMLFDKPYKCLAFAILRFAAFGSEQSLQRVSDFAEAFLRPYAGDEAVFVDVVNAMKVLELEKLLRILYRCAVSGAYPRFMENVLSVHYANYQIAIELNARIAG
jgi:hypothetical protein